MKPSTHDPADRPAAVPVWYKMQDVLREALVACDVDAVKRAIDQGADVNRPIHTSLDKNVYIAGSWHRVEWVSPLGLTLLPGGHRQNMMRILREQGARVDDPIWSNERGVGPTALWLAMDKLTPQALLLLRWGARVNVEHEGTSVLTKAIRIKSNQLFQAVIDGLKKESWMPTPEVWSHVLWEYLVSRASVGKGRERLEKLIESMPEMPPEQRQRCLASTEKMPNERFARALLEAAFVEQDRAQLRGVVIPSIMSDLPGPVRTVRL